MMMQNSSARSRPMVYNQKPNKADLYSLVHGNPSQAYSVNMPSIPFPVPPPQPHTSLFDRYNRPNLYLRDCDEKDLIPLTKNIVMHQQNLSGELADCISRKAQKQKVPSRAKPAEASERNSSTSLRQAEDNARPSRQFVQNEILFSYKQMGEIKRKKKEDYLNTIQMMVADAERHIKDIEALQQEEQKQMQGIYHDHGKINHQLTNNLKTGLIEQSLAYITPLSPSKPETLHIHQQMNPKQINEILEQHIKMNEDLLERASRARSKEPKQEPASSTQGQKFGKTLKRPLDLPKSAMSTTKDGFKAKKGRMK